MAPYLYPPAPPALTGDVVTLSRFLNNPTLVQRDLRTVAQQRFISDVLLTGRQQASGGAFLYETGEPIYTDRAPEVVNAGSKYPRAKATTGNAATASTSKWGQDVPITDESIGRQGRITIDRAMLKCVNYLVQTIDGVCLTAIGAAITQVQAVSNGAWSASGATPFRDAMLAKAIVMALNQGYDPDTLVMDDLRYAEMVSNANVLAGLARESSNTVTETGDVLVLAGMRILRTPNLPAGTSAMITDTTMLGSLGYERIPSPEYQGDPATGVESWIRRDPDGNDAWLLRGRRPVVPLVQEPACSVKITGV